MQVDTVDRNECISPAPDYYVTQIFTNFQYQWAILKVIKPSSWMFSAESISSCRRHICEDFQVCRCALFFVLKLWINCLENIYSILVMRKRIRKRDNLAAFFFTILDIFIHYSFYFQRKRYPSLFNPSTKKLFVCVCVNYYHSSLSPVSFHIIPSIWTV